MTSKIIATRNGAKLFEAELVGGNPPQVLDRQYTVTSNRTPVPLYQGPSKEDAVRAFEEVAK